MYFLCILHHKWWNYVINLCGKKDNIDNISFATFEKLLMVNDLSQLLIKDFLKNFLQILQYPYYF